MSYLWRVRIDSETLNRADRVAERLGTTTGAVVRVLVTRIARTGSIPPGLCLADVSATTQWELRAEALERFYDPSKIW
jgi:antitoxin component of RelBE/YafQ-DinJ toxin-antitoxin module